MGDHPPVAGIDQPNEQTWLLLNDELRHRHDSQRSSFDKLESRAAIVLGAATGALLFVAKEDVNSPWLVPALAAFAGSIACSLIAVLPSRFEELGARALVVGLWLRSRGNAAAELANARLAAIEENVARQARMVRFARASVALIWPGRSCQPSTSHKETDPMSSEPTNAQPATPPPPQVPTAATADPPSQPQPGVPTMHLLETDIRALTASAAPPPPESPPAP
jgi:hypothetical protein